MSEIWSQLFVRHAKANKHKQIVKLLRLCAETGQGAHDEALKVVGVINGRIDDQAAQSLVADLRVQLASGAADTIAGFAVYQGRVGSDVASHVESLLGALRSISYDVDARVYACGDDDPWELFARVDDGVVVTEQFEPDSGKDEVALRRGVYAWWHHGLDAEVQQGYLYDDRQRDPAIENYAVVDRKTSGQKITADDWAALKSLLRKSKVHDVDSQMRSAAEVRAGLEFCDYPGYSVFDFSIKATPYHEMYLAVISSLSYLLKHQVLTSADLNPAMAWLLDSSVYKVSSAHNPKDGTGFISIKGEQSIRINFAHAGNRLSLDAIAAVIELAGKICGCETLVDSNVKNPKRIRLVHFPAAVAAAMKELRVYDDWNSFRSRQ